MATTSETSAFTSVRQRIRKVLEQPAETDIPLLPFADELDKSGECDTTSVEARK